MHANLRVTILENENSCYVIGNYSNRFFFNRAVDRLGLIPQIDGLADRIPEHPPSSMTSLVTSLLNYDVIKCLI